MRYLFGYNLTNVSDTELIVVLKATLVPELRVRSLQTDRPTNSDTFKNAREGYQENMDESWEKGVDEVDDGE